MFGFAGDAGDAKGQHFESVLSQTLMVFFARVLAPDIPSACPLIES